MVPAKTPHESSAVRCIRTALLALSPCVKVRAAAAAGCYCSLDESYREYRGRQHAFSAFDLALPRSAEPRRVGSAHYGTGGDLHPTLRRAAGCAADAGEDDSGARGCAPDQACCDRQCATQGGTPRDGRASAACRRCEHVGRRRRPLLRRTVLVLRSGMAR